MQNDVGRRDVQLLPDVLGGRADLKQEELLLVGSTFVLLGSLSPQQHPRRGRVQPLSSRAPFLLFSIVLLTLKTLYQHSR